MRAALAFLTIATAVMAVPPASARTWSSPQATDLVVRTISLDDKGRGAFAGGATLVPVAADGRPGTPIAYSDTTAPIAFDVSDTGRLAVVARLADGSLGVGTGTTSAPPTTLASYVAAREGQEIDRGYRVAIGRDGRLLVAWSQTGESGSALVAARQAPGAPSPQLSVLDSYTATTGGYPASFSVTGAILDNSGRSLVALEQSSPTGPYAYIRRSVGPDGAFDRALQILSSGRYTFATRSFLEGTGAVTSFAFAVDTTGQGPGGIFSRRLTAAGRTTRDVGLGPVARHFAWGADVGPKRVHRHCAVEPRHLARPHPQRAGRLGPAGAEAGDQPPHEVGPARRVRVRDRTQNRGLPGRGPGALRAREARRAVRPDAGAARIRRLPEGAVGGVGLRPHGRCP